MIKRHIKALLILLPFILISCSGKPNEYLCYPDTKSFWDSPAYFEYNSNGIIFIPIANETPEEYIIISDNEYSLSSKEKKYGWSDLYFDKKIKEIRWRVHSPSDPNTYQDIYFTCKDYE